MKSLLLIDQGTALSGHVVRAIIHAKNKEIAENYIKSEILAKSPQYEALILSLGGRPWWLKEVPVITI